MKFNDLRDYLQKVDEMGELKEVLGADAETEIGPITEITAWSKEHPMLLFDEIKGYPKGYRIACHVFDSYKRQQLVYGFPDGLKGRALVKWWKDKLDNYEPIPAEEVHSGPVMENVQTGNDVDIRKFPAPMWHAEDAAPYLGTGSASVLRDPDDGRLNIGAYRGMIYDRNTLGHHLAAGHDGQVIRDKYFERGENCPIVIALGMDPHFLQAAAENVRYNQEELGFAGFLRGEPVEVISGPLTGLPIPATAEIVLEGEIMHPEVEPMRVEGPWGEGPGYYTAGFPQPLVKVHAVYHRNDPILMGEPTLRFRERGSAGNFAQAARRWHMLEQSGLGGVKGVGQIGPMLVISLKQAYSGHVMRVADFAMTGLSDRPPHYLVLVDEDIDPTNQHQVLWAINTRCDPAAQVHILRDRWCSAVNPAGLTPEKRAIEDYAIGAMVIDACKPFRWRHQWDQMFKLSDIDEERRATTAAKWESVLGELITAPKPL
jgi:UbiD family decarboxylase